MPRYSRDISSSGNKRRIVIAAVSAVVVVGLAVGVFFGVQAYQESQERQQHEEEVQNVVEDETFYDGIIVQGVDLGGMTMAQARQALEPVEESLRGTYSVTVARGEQSWVITEADLDFTYNTEEVLQEAYQYGREGTDEERYTTVQALKEQPKEWEITVTMDDSGIGTKMQEIADSIDTDPVNATVASFDASTETFQFNEGVPGVKTDVEALTQLVQSALENGGTGVVEVPVEEVPYEVSAADLQGVMKKLGTYSTVSTNTADGNHNMKLAMESINGVVVGPGETFSYNDATGDTTTSANGYRLATAFSNGRRVQEYGGGICQVSSTLYGAALRSNMQIIERSNHMMPVGYCPLGQDATVSYGSLDFKFKNPTDYPVYIVGDMTGTRLTVTLYGYQSPSYDTIEVSSWQTGTLSQPEDTYEVNNSLAKNEIKLIMQGRNGQTAAAERTFYKDGKAVKTESLPSSRYRALATIYEVGPGTDTSQIVNGSIPGSTPSTPESSAPESSAPESSAPESSTPESSAPESSAPESSTPESSAPESSSSESPASSQGDPGVIITPPSVTEGEGDGTGETSPSQPPASEIPVG